MPDEFDVDEDELDAMLDAGEPVEVVGPPGEERPADPRTPAPAG